MIAIGGLWRSVTQRGAAWRSVAQRGAASSMVGTLWKVALNLLRRSLGPSDLAEHA